MSGRGREAHSNFREGSGGPPKSAEGVGTPTRKFGGPPTSPRGVGRPNRRSDMGWEAHPEV